MPSTEVVLDRGLSVTGRVTDEEGHPIAGARIRTKFLNDIRETTTKEDGSYILSGCEPRTARIVVTAKGHATDMQEVQIAPEMEPVDFRLPPGGTVRIRVLDEQGKPVPKARIYFQHWRGRFQYFEFDHVNQYADENGVWEWNEAPLDEFQADIVRPGGMSLAKQPLIARAEEYVFRTPPALVITGKVVDAKTKTPIEPFRVIPGIRSSEEHMNWVESQSFNGENGEFRLRETHGYLAYLVRVEAPGYLPAVSRDIASDARDVSVEFELEKGKDIAATVLTPDHLPAAEAKVAPGVKGSQITVKNGDLEDGSTYAPRASTDEAGRFRLRPQSEKFQLVITHPTGYAHVRSEDGPIPKAIQLTAWARVEGTFRIGSDRIAGALITINVSGLHSYGDDDPRVYSHHYATTGPEGQFTFERVVAGEGRIGRRITLMVGEGAQETTSSTMIAARFPEGRTTRIDLGGTGRPVTGQLKPPRGNLEKVMLNFAMVSVRPDVPQAIPPALPKQAPNDPAERQAWLDQMQAERAAYEAYQASVRAKPYFSATVDQDGRFRIDDMPPGDYVLSVRFNEQPVGRISMHRFNVPDDDQARIAVPMDLGNLILEPLSH